MTPTFFDIDRWIVAHVNHCLDDAHHRAEYAKLVASGYWVISRYFTGGTDGSAPRAWVLAYDEHVRVERCP